MEMTDELREALEQRIRVLEQANVDLINRNMQLAEQVDAYYDVRRRIQMFKELVLRHKELVRQADLRNDDELMTVIETRLEKEMPHCDPDFGIRELAELVGTSQTRLLDLFRSSSLYKSVDDYLDYMRLLRSLYLLHHETSWSIAACATEAGFKSIRTFNRKFHDAIGMTPREFRELVESGERRIAATQQQVNQTIKDDKWTTKDEE